MTDAIDPQTRADAAHVLRSAALVSEYSGYAREAFVTYNGSACAVGALRLAGGSYRLETYPVRTDDRAIMVQLGLDPNARHYFRDSLMMSDLVTQRNRLAQELAVRTLSEMVPTTCTHPSCGNPAYHESYARHQQDPNADVLSRNEIVYHFNDYVCTGGEELQLLFVQAAEKLEADL